MNYEEMSDLQINLLVANAIGVDAAENSGVVFGAVKHDGDNVVSVIGVVDYCNNPSDAWPIMEANGIATVSENGVIIGATSDSQSFYDPHSCSEISCFGTKALRAAMIVFLMMQEQAK